MTLGNVDVNVRWGRLPGVVFSLRRSVVTLADGSLVERRVLVVEGMVVVVMVRRLEGRTNANRKSPAVVDCQERPVG